jgi:hypothetical protein
MRINKNSLPTVAVLLATHKPGDYIYPQIHSIKNQIGVNLQIYWGDFGSSFEEKERIRECLYGCKVNEVNIASAGPANNFFTLLRESKEEYVSFCDQDDVWLPNKTINQITILHNAGQIPALVHSNSAVLQNEVISTKPTICLDHSFNSLAFYNCCQGCTMTMNAAAREVILENLPDEIIWHDWWAALVISLTGKIFFSKDTDTLYRLHDNNAIGIPTKMRRVTRFICRKPGLVSYQIQSALNLFGHRVQLEEKELFQIKRIISPNRVDRFVGALKDVKRRPKAYEDLIRRILLVIKQP